jgi:hypothetical protein
MINRRIMFEPMDIWCHPDFLDDPDADDDETTLYGFNEAPSDCGPADDSDEE